MNLKMFSRKQRVKYLIKAELISKLEFKESASKYHVLQYNKGFKMLTA